MRHSILRYAAFGVLSIVIVVLGGGYATGKLSSMAASSWFIQQEPEFVEAAGQGTVLADSAAAAASASSQPSRPEAGAQSNGVQSVQPRQGAASTEPQSSAPSLSEEQLALLEAIRLEKLQAQADERQHRRQRQRMAGEAPLGNSLYSLKPIEVTPVATTGLSPTTDANSSPNVLASLTSQIGSNPSLQSILQPQTTVPTTPIQPVSTLPAALVSPEAQVQPTSIVAPQSRPVQPQGTQALERGTFISAAMLTELRSELPGLVRAIVTDPVYDSQTGHYEMIPKGALLIGQYETETAPGQLRLLVAWDEIQFPDGRIVPLNRQGVVDARGASGITGKRQTGFLTTIITGALVNLAGNAGRTQTGTNDLSSLAGQPLGQSVSNATQDYMSTRLARGPRFTIKPGEVVNVLLDTPLYLKGRRIY